MQYAESIWQATLKEPGRITADAIFVPKMLFDAASTLETDAVRGKLRQIAIDDAAPGLLEKLETFGMEHPICRVLQQLHTDISCITKIPSKNVLAEIAKRFGYLQAAYARAAAHEPVLWSIWEKTFTSSTYLNNKEMDAKIQCMIRQAFTMEENLTWVNAQLGRTRFNLIEKVRHDAKLHHFLHWQVQRIYNVRHFLWDEWQAFETITSTLMAHLSEKENDGQNPLDMEQWKTSVHAQFRGTNALTAENVTDVFKRVVTRGNKRKRDETDSTAGLTCITCPQRAAQACVARMCQKCCKDLTCRRHH